ncbi:glycoside hydrolase family 3 protein [Collybiopsis luxurians FD-317 M1]|uniref:beta-glucosidase n=1 Tax=Collybiopsis luxurians FD-317 M1 TaxID=944289 RepID=A0A0D0CEV3_9AGAR|nr:glycoside hydrolase family 3 protein [Collybiopsis luxurians FD-317 M1]
MSFTRLALWLASTSLVLAQSSSNSTIEATSTASANLSTSTVSISLPLSTVSSFSSALSSSSELSTSSALSSFTSIVTANATSSLVSASTASANVSVSSVPASTSATSNASTSTSASATTSVETSPLTQTRTTIPIEPFTFSSFPVPSQTPVPALFPLTDPKDPPPVGAPVVPDFEQAWATAYQKAQALIADFSLHEKINITTGVGWTNGLCVGNIGKIRDFPGLCLEDSPLGVRFGDFVTGFPAGINAATTWNRDLIRRRGQAMGQEHVGKGVNIALGPMMNMGRVAEGGRNWEGFGADPFLSGEAAYETILGLQGAGVQACAKHFINNEQEHYRTLESSDVDDRTQHEIYAHPFLRSVMAGVASVMCSYNLINGTYACENDKMMNGILKGEFGFQGFIMSDWWATESTMAVETGLDMTMAGDIVLGSHTTYFGQNLTAYVKNGTVPESRIDDMATRIIASWYFLHQDDPDYPKTNFNAFLPDDAETNFHIDVQDDHDQLVREIGAASTVLLKNVNGALPLTGKERRLFMAGSDAGPADIGPNKFADQGGQTGILAMGWGSGTANFTYLISPYEAIQQRARRNRTSVSWTFDDFDLDRAGNMAIGQSVCLVFINSDSGEEYITVDGNEGDRKNLTAWHGGDDLVLAVAAQNNNTVVVVHSVGPLILEPWIEHPNVTAVLWAGLPGNEAGNAITDVLYGDWNPSGRLPYTIAKDASDYPTSVIQGEIPGEQQGQEGGGDIVLNITYSEMLEIDYRWFDAKNITPRFEFGFGLSYTTFEYSNLNIEKITFSDGEEQDDEARWEAGQASRIAVGSSTALWLHRPAYNITFDVTNTGAVYGGDIPQVYLHHPASACEPPSILKGFTHVEVMPGETRTVSIRLSRYDLSIWDVVDQGWKKPDGTVTFSVSRSSRDERLTGTIPA